MIAASVSPASVSPASVSPASVSPEPVGALSVMDRLALVVSAAGQGGLAGVDSEQALRVIEAVEAVKAWADSVSLAATSAMVCEFETDFVHLAPEKPTTWGWTRFARTCRSAAAREIQVATGLPITQCQRRVWLAACEPDRVGPVRKAMRLGRVTFARALALTEATADLDTSTAAGIASRVLAPLTGPDGLPLAAMAPLSQATFTARLHRQLVIHHGLVAQAERTHDEAVGRRDVRGEPGRDGTGLLVVSGDGPRISAAACRVDLIARRLRRDGDDRTLAQLRADVATDLLLGGWIPDDPTFARLGQPPTAVVNVVVSLSTLLGVDTGVGHIPGWGALSAQQTRELALTAGSIWTRIVTDPLTGRAIEATAGTYRVPAAMATQVNARDQVCRAPGCEIPTTRTDLDHSIEWKPGDAGGPTAETNLAALHRGHHNLKTTGFWDSEQSADGTLAWTTATGRTVKTYPYIYDHPDNLPIATSNLEARLGRRVARFINPLVPLPGHVNIFDEIDWTAPPEPAPVPASPDAACPEPAPWHSPQQWQPWPRPQLEFAPHAPRRDSRKKRPKRKLNADLLARFSGPPPF
jgi:hypothetical protein